MNDAEEVIRQTGACLRRLQGMESQFTVTGPFEFAQAGAVMGFLDALQRAQWHFEQALMDIHDD